MAAGANVWALAVVLLAGQVLDTQGHALRSELHAEQRRLRTTLVSSDREILRTSMLKTMPPFDINPATFLSLVSAVPTDSLLLFFSPTCPDCEKLFPLWSRVAGMFEDNRDLTILSVSDDAGKAPPPYTHDENPAVFFIPKGGAARPIPFPMSDLHEFVDLPETPESDADIVNKLVSFTRSHLSTATGTGPPAAIPAAPPPRNVARPQRALSESQSAALTARLLASLQAKEASSLEEQLKIVYEPHYGSLPVVKFLKEFVKSPTGILGRPLAEVAATYLDGLPLAAQWANQYAAQQDAIYRKQGWHPDPTEEQSYFQDLLNYAIPLYARSIYMQRGV